MRIQTFYQKSDIGTDNHVPIYIRIYHNGKSAYIRQIWRVHKNHFITKSGNFKLNDRKIESLIDEKITEYTNIIKEYGTFLEDWDVQDIKKLLLENSSKFKNFNFITYFERYINEMKAERSIRVS